MVFENVWAIEVLKDSLKEEFSSAVKNAVCVKDYEKAAKEFLERLEWSRNLCENLHVGSTLMHKAGEE